MTVAGHKKGPDIFKAGLMEAGVGTYGVLSATIGFVGTVLAAVIDPILGKEKVREAQLYVRAALQKGILVPMIGAIYKYPPTQLKFQEILTNISTMMGPQERKLVQQQFNGKKISMWHPTSDQLKINRYMKKVVVAQKQINTGNLSVKDARQQRNDIQGLGRENTQKT